MKKARILVIPLLLLGLIRISGHRALPQVEAVLAQTQAYFATAQTTFMPRRCGPSQGCQAWLTFNSLDFPIGDHLRQR
jgi:hypothetical protein